MLVCKYSILVQPFSNILIRVFKSVSGTRFGSLESEKIIIESLESEKIGSLHRPVARI